MRTGQHHRPETLLAGMNAAFAELVILTPAVLAQEERPFQTPFLAPAHKSPSSGASSAGRLVRAFPFRALPFCVLQSLPDGRLFLRRGPARLGLGFLQFLTTAAVVDDPVDHAVVILQGHFRRAQRVFRLHGTDTICPLMLANSSGRLNCSVYFWIMSGAGMRSSPAPGPPPGRCPPRCRKSPHARPGGSGSGPDR